MKQSFIKRIKQNTPLIIALLAFVIFSGNKNPGGEKDTAATNCCSGYSISMNKLKQFMLDSLHGNQFEGGVYAKADLIAAINKVPGDSVYLMNILKNCNLARGTDLALTSPNTTGVVFVGQPNCYPCPGKACCPQKVCAARISRGCINYTSYNGFMDGSEPNVLPAEE
jgi:hypothetical protein